MRQRYRAPTASEASPFEQKIVRSILALISTLLLIAWPSSICIEVLDSPSKIPSFPAAAAFSTFNLGQERLFIRQIKPVSKVILNAYKPVVVVGKIIVDEYGDPFPHSKDEHTKKNEIQSTTPAPPKTVSIGGVVLRLHLVPQLLLLFGTHITMRNKHKATQQTHCHLSYLSLRWETIGHTRKQKLWRSPLVLRLRF